MRQKVYGVIMLVLCVGIIALAAQGFTMEERDATPVLLLAPLGLYLIFTKKDWVYAPPEPDMKDEPVTLEP